MQGTQRKCLKCGETMRVKETRSYEDEIYRQCVCPNCGAAYYTVEFPIEANAQFFNYWAENNRYKVKKEKKSWK